MKSINFELSRMEKEGKRQILSRVTFSRDYRPRLKTGIYIRHEHFRRGEIQIPRNMKDKDQKSELIRAKSLLKVFHAHALLLANSLNGRHLSKATMETLLHPEYEDSYEVFASKENLMEAIEGLEPHEKTFYDYMDDYVQCKNLSEGRIKLYNALKRLVLRYDLFQKKAGASSLTLEYPCDTRPENLCAFVSYMEKEKQLAEKYPRTFKSIIEEVAVRIPTPQRQVFLRIQNKSRNTIHEIIKIFSAIYGWLHDRGIIGRNDLLSQVQRPDPVYLQPFYLSVDERKQIDGMVIERKGNLNEVKDIFIFHCYTGCRYGDLCRLTAGNIIDGVLTYQPSKTRKHTNQVIPRVPLSARALELVEKYRGKDTEGRLFPFPKHATYIYDIKQILKRAGIDRTVYVYDRKTRDYKAVPLYEAAATHLARKTFIGTIYKQVKDPSIISTMSGHSQGSKSFSRYRKIDDEDRREVINGMD